MTSAPATWASSQVHNVLIKTLKKGPIPEHVAIVMDGNRRWAKERDISIAAGHMRGFQVLEEVRNT
jgi:ditrans,polycis-polyprenyl diphosphate synthase